MGIISTYCTHRHVTRTRDGKYFCLVCPDEGTPRIRKHPEGRPHQVNGYWLSPADYELVMGYRRDRDRAIDAARTGYAARLKGLLDLVEKEIPRGE